MKNNWATVSLCITFLLIFSSALSHASGEVEDYFSMTPAELAAVPVTIASGTPTPNFKSAGSTSVITEEQIRTMGATELHEVLETVPGMHASLQPITNDLTYSVRGIANSSNSQILILLNGTRITSPFRGSIETSLDIPVAAIQRVEVIRGPGSAVYGADAFAGVINIVTKKAKDINGTQLGVRAGNWDTQSGWGQHGSQWAGWDIAASIQYSHSAGDSDRIIQQDTQSQIDEGLAPFGLPAASLAPGALNTRYKSFNSHLNLQRKHWDIGFWAFNGYDIGTRSGGNGALDPKGAGESSQYLGDVRFSTEDWFTDWEFLAHLSYLHSDVAANVNIFPNNAILPVDGLGNIIRPEPGSLPPRLVSFPDGAKEDIRHVQRIPSLELSSVFRGVTDHLFKFSTGVRYEEIAVNHLTNNGSGAFNGLQPPLVQDGTLKDVSGSQYAFLRDNSRTIWSAMLQDEWQIANDWHLTAGVRYDHYSDFGSTVNPRFALVWDINEQLTSKFMYGKAFRAPSFTELGTQNNPILKGNKNLSPEVINTVEWAFDYRPFSSLRTGLNLYYYHLQDLITTSPVPKTNISQYNNSGNQDGYGTELEWNWTVTDQVNLAGNYAWQHALNDSTQIRVTGVPEHHVYFAGAWQFLPKWQFQSQLNWVGGRTIDTNDPRPPLKDYETIDFTLRGKKLWGHLNIAASLRNAFDANNQEPARIDRPFNFPMPGRSFYLETSVDF